MPNYLTLPTTLSSNNSPSRILGSGYPRCNSIRRCDISVDRLLHCKLRQLTLNLLIAVRSLHLWQLHWLVVACTVVCVRRVHVVLVVSVYHVVWCHYFAVSSYECGFKVGIYRLGTVSVLLLGLLHIPALCLLCQSQSHSLCHFPHLLVTIV